MHTEREEQGGKNKFGSYTQKFCLKIVFLFYRLDGREREGTSENVSAFIS